MMNTRDRKVPIQASRFFCGGVEGARQKAGMCVSLKQELPGVLTLVPANTKCSHVYGVSAWRIPEEGEA